MVAKQQTRSPEITAGEGGADSLGQERAILFYRAGRDNEPPHRYWAFVETDRGTVYATGDTRQLLEDDIIDCAAMLGYNRNSVMLVALD